MITVECFRYPANLFCPDSLFYDISSHCHAVTAPLTGLTMSSSVGISVNYLCEKKDPYWIASSVGEGGRLIAWPWLKQCPSNLQPTTTSPPQPKAFRFRQCCEYIYICYLKGIRRSRKRMPKLLLPRSHSFVVFDGHRRFCVLIVNNIQPVIDFLPLV